MSTPRAVWEGSSGMSCEASASVEVCGSSGYGGAEVSRVAGEGPASAEGSRTAAPSVAVGTSASVDIGCTGSCEGSTWAAVSSDEFVSLESDDLDESSPSLMQICFHNKE